MKRRLLSGLLAFSMVLAMVPVLQVETKAATLTHSLIFNDAIWREDFMQQYYRVETPVVDDINTSAGVLFELQVRSNSVGNFPAYYFTEKFTLIYESYQRIYQVGSAWSNTYALNDTQAGESFEFSAANSNDAKLRITAEFANNGGTTYIQTGSSVMSVSATTSGRTMTNDLAYTAGDGLIIGGSGGTVGMVSNVSMGLVDNTAPKLSSAYMSTGGSYIYVTMDEYIQMPDGASSSDFSGGLTATYVNNATGVSGGSMYCELISVSQGALMFKVPTEDTADSDFTISRLNNIWVKVEDETETYDYDIYGMYTANDYRTGASALTGQYIYDTTTYANKMQYVGTTQVDGPIIDLAGNPLASGTLGSLDVSNLGLTVDNVPPTVSSITVTGSMITEETPTGADEWPADIDKSSVFASVGDTLDFTVNATEAITVTYGTLANGYMQLNVKDSSGDYVTLKYLGKETADDLVNSGTYGKIYFETFTVEKGMYLDDGDTFIKPTYIYGPYYDGGNNALDIDDWPPPDKQICLDINAPTLTVTHIADGDGDEATHSFQLDITDFGEGDTMYSASGLLGKEATVSARNSANLEMDFAVTKDSTAPTDDEAYDNDGTIELESENQTYYLHSKLVDKEVSERYINFIVSATMEDYAGNATTASGSSGYTTIDTVAPTSKTYAFNVAKYTDYTEVKIGVSFSDDNMDGGYRAYQWDDGEVQYVDSLFYIYATKQYTENLNATHTFTYWAEDGYGNEMEPVTIEFEINREKPYGSVSVFEADPTADPTVTLTAAVDSVDEEKAYTRVTLVPYKGEGEAVDDWDALYEDTTFYSTVISSGAEYEDVFSDQSLTWYSYYGDSRFTSGTSPYAPIAGMITVFANYLKTGDGTADTLYGMIETKSMETMTGISALPYGEYWVVVENAYYNLEETFTNSSTNYCLFSGATTSYTIEAMDDHIYYAPATDDIHEATLVGKLTDADGKDMDTATYEGYDYVTVQQDATGITANFTVDNALMKDEYCNWDLTDLDFEESYVALFKATENDGTITLGDALEATKLSLGTTVEQTYTIPETGELETGVYAIAVVTVSKAGSAQTHVLQYVVLDNQPIVAAFGMTYGATTGVSLPNGASFYQESTRGSYYSISYTENATVDAPLDIFYIGAGNLTESYTSTGQFATITDRTATATRTFKVADPTTTTVLGNEFGEIAGMAIWNKASTQGEVVYDTITNGVVAAGWVYDTMVDSVADLADTSKDTLSLAPGGNTICMQLLGTNGNLSDIKEMTYYVQTAAPTLMLNSTYAKSSTDETGTQVLEGEFSVASAFSELGDVDIYLLAKGYFAINGEVRGYQYDNTTISGIYAADNYYQFQTIPLETTDTVTLWGQTLRSGNTYGYTYSERQSYVTSATSLDNCTAMFMAVDKSGNATYVVPQFNDADDTGEGDDYEDPTLYSYSFDRVSIISSGNNENYTNYAMYTTGMDYANSTVTFFGGDLGDEEVTLNLENPVIPNAAGYTGCFYYDTGDGYDRLSLEYDRPYAESAVLLDSRSFTVTAVGIAGGTASHTGTPYDFYSSNGLDLSAESYYRALNAEQSYQKYYTDYMNVESYYFENIYWEHGTGFTDVVQVPVNLNGTYEMTLMTSYGDYVTESVTCSSFTSANGYNQDNLSVTLDRIYYSTDPVTATITTSGDKADVDIKSISVSDGAEGSIAIDGKTATVKVMGNCTITVTFADDTTNHFKILNVYSEPVNATHVWSYQSEVWDETAQDYVLTTDTPDSVDGSVSVYIFDEETGEMLYDARTGTVATYTFVYGGDTSYTFEAGTLKNAYGMANAEDYTIDLETTLNEIIPAELLSDITAPSVQVLAYSVQSGIAAEKEAYLTLYDMATQWANGDLLDYSAFDSKTQYTDTVTFMEAVGWATTYRFQVQVSDQSTVKLVLKEGLYAETPGYDDTSDTIEGVSLSGYTLDVSENAAFTLFVVDKQGNATAVPLEITQISDAPVPTYAKTFDENGNAIITLTVPAEGENLSITAVTTATGTDSVGTVQGLVVTLEENDTYKIDYAYTYRGEPVSGTLTVTVAELDNTAPTYTITWSANKLYDVTNQDVTATLTYNKVITDVKAVAASVEDQTTIEANVELRHTASVVTVKFHDNVDADFDIMATATNGKSVTTNNVAFATTNIDKTAPVVDYSLGTLATDGKSQDITFTADETVATPKVGGTFKETTITATANGTVDYTFTDLAGNSTLVSVPVTELVTDNLVLSFSTTLNGATTQDAGELDVDVGDTIYVSANRNCTVDMNHDDSTIEYYKTTNDPISFTIAEDQAGLYPVIYATDTYGNTTMDYLSKIPPLDTVAPVVSVKSYTISANVDIETADLKAKLKANLNMADGYATNYTPTEELVVTYSACTRAVGTQVITYTVTDLAGNSATATGFLRFYDGTEPVVTVDGIEMARDGVITLDAVSVLNVSVENNAPYSVSYKAGIKTVAQLKTGATDLGYHMTGSEDISLAGLESGYYTFCVQTQERDYYCFIIKVQ